MKKAIWPIICAVLVLVCLVLLDRSCGNDKELAKWKSDYATLKVATEEAQAASKEHIAILEAAQASLQGQIDSTMTIIASKDAVIASLRSSVTASNAVTAALRTEVQPVLDTNPKVAALVASLDAGIVLRDNLIVEQDGVITALKDRVALGDERYANQVAITQEWQSMYERESALRVNCEKGLSLYEKHRKSDKIWKAVGKFGPPIAFVAGMFLTK